MLNNSYRYELINIHIMTTEELKERAIQKLKNVQSWNDIESAHGAADNVLCDLLENLGFKDVIEEYNKINKYYA